MSASRPDRPAKLLAGCGLSVLLLTLACCLTCRRPEPGDARAELAPRRPNSAATAVPRGPESEWLIADWPQRHEELVETARRGSIDLLFLGDSITAAWATTGAAVWQRHYGALRAAYFGIGGDQTEHVLWRVQHGELEGIAPEVIVLLIGTNNLYSNTPAEIAEGIGAILKEIRRRSPRSHVLLMGILPRGRSIGAPERAAIRAVNEIISGYADDMVTYLDIGPHLVDPDGNLRPDLMLDSVHPSEAGYEVWARAIEPFLSQHLSAWPEP